MTLREKLLYHHAHPAKLAADLFAAAAAAWLLWNQHLLRAAAVGLVLPALASAVVLGFADLNRVTQSPMGRYVGRNMSIERHAMAVAGVFVMWLAMWYHSTVYGVAGGAIAVLAWTRIRLRR